MCPLMQAYKEIRLYGTIEYDNDYKTAWGQCRCMVIRFDGKTYAVNMLNGEVSKIETIG